LTKEMILTSSSQTYHHDAIKVGDKNFYISDFGKVYTGEIFRGLIILTNKSETHAINNIELAVYSTCQNKNQTRTLAKETVDVIERGASYSKIIEIRADYNDSYVIELKAKYKSDLFKEKLRQMDIDNMTPAQKSKIQSKESYRIDYATHNVTRNFTKKFKFQTRSPFQLAQKIFVRQNKYFMEITLENESTNLFLQSVNLELTNTDLDLQDLNQLDEEDEIMGSIMKKKEKRSFVYVLTPKGDSYVIKKNEKVGIGKVEIRWQNGFGDLGVLIFGPFIYMEETGRDIEFIYEKSTKLTIEEPKWVEMYIMNCTNRMLKFDLEIDNEAKHNITIHGLSRYVLKKLGPGDKSKFKVLLFPQYLGIHRLNGLIAKDKYSGNIYTLTDKDSEVTFDVQNTKSDPFDQADGVTPDDDDLQNDPEEPDQEDLLGD
jgi:hypothetical protein